MAERSESEKCPTCGTVKITFDPPLYFEAGEACCAPGFIAISVNGTPASSQPIKCCNFKGHENSDKIHERNHYYLTEEIVSWPSTR
jgi:hypothetical protein